MHVTVHEGTLRYIKYIFLVVVKVYFLCVGHSFAYVAQLNYCEMSEFELRVLP
jgi:hypothetical protein